MRPVIASFLVPFALAACTAPVPVGDPLPVMSGYRSPGDLCKRVGENAFTNQFLDDSADLVGCPGGGGAAAAFVSETGAVEVARYQGWILYSVSRG
ncbi:hypothetical protein [Defluviimonas sp. SAOS-178_SWC]|uniref:hypothetical protein n=1 Tax=Defluviimonas sp. SAOS-178_SWC TaxID=3121287 RepID=UPI003221B9F2